MEDFVEQISTDRPGAASVQRSAMLEVRFLVFSLRRYLKEMKGDICFVWFNSPKLSLMVL